MQFKRKQIKGVSEEELIQYHTKMEELIESERKEERQVEVLNYNWKDFGTN